jgi:hypothetical protein
MHPGSCSQHSPLLFTDCDGAAQLQLWAPALPVLLQLQLLLPGCWHDCM